MKKLISISLAVIFLLGNLGFTMATHYCGGHAVKNRLMVGTHSLDCGMSNMDKSCENKGAENQLSKKSCCEDQYQNLSVDDDYDISQFHVNKQLQFVVAFIHSYFATYSIQVDTEHQFIGHSPPLQGRDILVLNQVFRI